MIQFVKNIRGKRSGRVSSDHDDVSGCDDIPLDHRLSFEPEKDERWTFERDGRVLVNDVDLEELVNSARSERDVALLCGASRGLQEYQLFVWSKGGKEHAQFNGRVQALQDKVHGILARLYDSLTGGVDLDLSEGEAWLNNVSVRKAIHLYVQNPSIGRRQYLIGLRDKLDLILARRRSNSVYDAVSAEAKSLLEEINMALDMVPASNVLCITDGSSRV